MRGDREGESGEGARGIGDGESGREGVERKRETREEREAGREKSGRNGQGGAGMTERLRGRQTSPLPCPFSKALMMISQCILLSQNLSCKKDSVKTATIAARDCVIRENYQVVSWEPGVGVGVGLR